VRGLGLLRRPMVLFGILTGAAVAIAVVLGWQAGDVSQIAMRPEAPAVWSLPSPQAPDPDRALAILAARRPWGGSSSFSDSETPIPLSAGSAWRLVGIVQRADERYALILIGTGPTAKVEYRIVGDTLPDGTKLVQIDTDSATSTSDTSSLASRRVHRLFEKSP
jgi:hypothetical protein